MNNVKVKPSIEVQMALDKKGHNERSIQQYKYRELLPHIKEQYEFRITNRLIIEKIINPRRDKTIKDSLYHVSKPDLHTKNRFYITAKSSSLNGRKVQKRKNQQKIIITSQNPSLSVFGDNQFVEQKKIKPNFISKRNRSYKKQQMLVDQCDLLCQSKMMPHRYNSQRDNYIGKIVKNGNFKPFFYNLTEDQMANPYLSPTMIVKNQGTLYILNKMNTVQIKPFDNHNKKIKRIPKRQFTIQNKNQFKQNMSIIDDF